ncbi:MAG: hypothetical protein N2544_15610, partial [Burkholderiales bacterium]|nr:hypothetical protein [Burkholderiales bacterium]
MNVLYEENGDFKVGTVLAESPASLQVEAPHGKRSKVKAANVLLRFDAPAAGELLGRAEAIAADIDTDFLWEASGDAEFGFGDLAREYFGRLYFDSCVHDPRALRYLLDVAGVATVMLGTDYP